MRSLWLASAAICLTAGAAMAQTTMSAPAPTGAPNAAVTAPNASPGNMAPANGTATMMPPPSPSAPPMPANPAPTGAPNAAQVTQPGASPGNMAPAQRSAPGMEAAGGPPMGAMKTHGHAMMMPEDADARTYLHIASDAIKHHNKALADDALSHAETRMLTRAVPASAGATQDDSPDVTAIEHARQALSAGDYKMAASDTKMAMHAHHGMMSELAQ